MASAAAVTDTITDVHALNPLVQPLPNWELSSLDYALRNAASNGVVNNVWTQVKDESVSISLSSSNGGSMDKFGVLKRMPAKLDIQNIDTDMIIRKQFLKTIKRTGSGVSLSYEMRYDT